MTNISKWFIAIPFSVILALIIPAVITGECVWFIHSWSAALYVLLTAGMWLAATAFVDVTKPRGRRDIANLFIPLGLILSVPISVVDRKFLISSSRMSRFTWCRLNVLFALVPFDGTQEV